MIIKAGVALAVVVLEGTLNRDTRESLSPVERSYLNDSFKYTAGGLLATALVARQMFKSGFVFRIMSANPCKYCRFIYSLSSHCLLGVVIGASLLGSIATMAGTMYTPPERPVRKHFLWLVCHFTYCLWASRR
jgi:hypothetical protein